MRTFLVLAFIAAIGSLALFAARHPTVARGQVIAADLLEQNHARGWRAMECDDEIPITADGAVFQCKLEMSDGDRARLELHLTKEGSFLMKVLDTTSAPEHSHVPSKADPWN